MIAVLTSGNARFAKSYSERGLLKSEKDLPTMLQYARTLVMFICASTQENSRLTEIEELKEKLEDMKANNNCMK